MATQGAATPKVKLTDVTLMWASLDTKNTMSDKYQVDLTNLSPDNVERIRGLGLAVKNRDDRPEKGFFITCKSTFPIIPMDKNGAIVKGTVGNGTKADVLLSYYIPKRRPPGAPERSPSLAKLVITDMVEFIPNAVAEDDGDL